MHMLATSVKPCSKNMSDITEGELSLSPTICDVAHGIDSYFLLHFWQEDEQSFAPYSISMLLEWGEEYGRYLRLPNLDAPFGYWRETLF
jgi:hypothetical protein